MQSTSTMQQQAAARRAQEAAERARRMKIMEEIRKLENEKEECESCIAELSGLEGELSSSQSSLSSALARFGQNALTGCITINGKFEGNGAFAVKGKVSDSTKQMDSLSKGILGISGAIGSQIRKLKTHIGKLETKINDLRAML